jgi:hypothetical protein
VWIDGIYLEPRIEDQAQCIPVIVGTMPEGKKEMVDFVRRERAILAVR